MNRIFIGYDHRQPISYNVLQSSIIRRTTKPVSISPLILRTLPITRQGLTPFTFSRFMVPYLCNYEGWALFLDIDMLVLGDISELFDLADDKYSAMVSKNEHKFEWASAILFNCSKCKVLTPEYVQKANNLHSINWLSEHQIGDIPREWNHLVGYDKPRPDAKLAHYTQGIPAFQETETSEYAKEWREELQFCNSTIPWLNLMGNSVHATKNSDGKIVPKFTVAA